MGARGLRTPSSFDSLHEIEMRSHMLTPTGYGPGAFAASPVRVRVRMSYLGSRWVQAPIADRREADT